MHLLECTRVAIASVVVAVVVRSPVHAVPEVILLLPWLKKSQTTKSVAFERSKVAGLPDPNAEGNILLMALFVSQQTRKSKLK